MKKALDYIETELINEEGLIIGCDWRDTMEKELGKKPLLTNNCLLHMAYRICGENRKAAGLRDRINQVFRKGNKYLDYPGNDRFDPLGGSFAVLHGVSSPEFYPGLIDSFRSVDTEFGFTIKCRHNPVSREEREVIDRTDGVVVWPFVVGFSILAVLKMGYRELAEEQLRKLIRLNGFREWYDPATGKGYGATEQLWSALLFLRAVRRMTKG